MISLDLRIDGEQDKVNYLQKLNSASREGAKWPRTDARNGEAGSGSPPGKTWSAYSALLVRSRLEIDIKGLLFPVLRRSMLGAYPPLPALYASR